MAPAKEKRKLVLNNEILSIAVSANGFSCHGFETRVILPSASIDAITKRQENSQ